MGLEYGRPGSDSDWRAVRELCCRAADSGRGIPPERWGFFAEYWITPYERLRPGWAYVAREDGTVAGYLTGCPDTAAFERSRLALRARLLAAVLLGRHPRTEEAARFLRRCLRREPWPEDLFPLELRRSLPSTHPAHLHVNVEERLRGRGVGRRLVELYCEDLRRARVPGVHLYCGAAPLEFYRRLGFAELGRAEARPGVPVHLLGLRL
jgi:GNAT superfamily N-acetyltransferase